MLFFVYSLLFNLFHYLSSIDFSLVVLELERGQVALMLEAEVMVV